MDFQLTDEQRLISESAREFCDKEIAPRVRENDRAGRFDRELASMLGEMGYLGAPVSEEYGGRSLDYLSYALIVEQVEGILGAVHKSGTPVLLVEQSMETALALAQRVYVMSKGQIVFSGSMRELQSSESVRKQYLEV